MKALFLIFFSITLFVNVTSIQAQEPPPLSAECEEKLPTECKDKPLGDCVNLPQECEEDIEQPIPAPIENITEPLPNDCMTELPLSCEQDPLKDCQEELSPVCQECMAILPPDCEHKPLSECSNPPPKCAQGTSPDGNKLPPPENNNCSNDNAGVYHPESLEANEGDDKTTLDIPRDDGGTTGFEIDSNGAPTFGIQPSDGKPSLSVKAPACAQVEVKDDGSFHQYFDADDGLQAELNASADGNFKVKLTPLHGKEMNLKAPSGSNVEMRDDGSVHSAFIHESGFESDLNISNNGDFEFKLRPPNKAPSKLKAPPGAEIEMNDDGSFTNHISHDNGIEHDIEGSTEGNFDFEFKHPTKKGFNFHLPAGSDIELRDDGGMREVLVKDKKRVEFDAYEDGEFEAKLEFEDKDNNKTREFLGIDGSDSSMGEEGNVTSIYNDYNNSLSYKMKFDENGTLLATISKLAPQTSTINKKRGDLGIVYYELEELVSYEMLGSYLDGGLSIDTYDYSSYRAELNSNTEAKIDANYTTDSSFSLKIDSNFTVSFSPLELSTFKEITYLDSSKEITLISGKCDIKIQKNNENFSLSSLSELKIDSNGIYVKDDLSDIESNSLTLNNGWNLISIPISAYINLDKFKSEKIWSFNDKKWVQNPSFLGYKSGYWAFMKDTNIIHFEGFTYSRDLSNLESNVWHLLGSGVDLTSFEESSTIFVFRENIWVKNPKVINKTEGFWIKK